MGIWTRKETAILGKWIDSPWYTSTGFIFGILCPSTKVPCEELRSITATCPSIRKPTIACCLLAPPTRITSETRLSRPNSTGLSCNPMVPTNSLLCRTCSSKPCSGGGPNEGGTGALSGGG